MIGNEEVHGPAIVGGDNVRYHRHKKTVGKNDEEDEEDDEEMQRGNSEITDGTLHKSH